MEMVEPSVMFVWDENSKRWVIKGDATKLCKWVNAETQICTRKGFETYGHTCLTPAPEVKNCWQPRDVYYDKLRKELLRLKREYGADFDDWFLAPYCLDEKCPHFKTETKTIINEWDEEEEVQLVVCKHYNNGCCGLPLKQFEQLLKQAKISSE